MSFLPTSVQNLNNSDTSATREYQANALGRKGYEGNSGKRGRKPLPPVPRTFDPMTGKLRDQYTEEKRLGIRRSTGAMKLKRLTFRHRKIIALHVNGTASEEIAFFMNCTVTTVSRILNDPLAQEYIAAAVKDREAELRALMGHAVGVVREGLTKPGLSIGDRLKAVDRFTKLKQVTGEQERGKETAEDLIAKMLERFQIVNNGNMQVNVGVPAGSEDRDGVGSRAVFSSPNQAALEAPHDANATVGSLAGPDDITQED